MQSPATFLKRPALDSDGRPFSGRRCVGPMEPVEPEAWKTGHDWAMTQEPIDWRYLFLRAILKYVFFSGLNFREYPPCAMTQEAKLMVPTIHKAYVMT